MKFCPETRSHYSDVDHMNETMVNEWNSIVEPEDKVYILGDVAFMQATKAAHLLKRLNGTKVLVKGNHDSKTVKDPQFVDCFESVHDYLEIKYDGNHIVMFHYPIAEWNRMHHGAVHFHGHLHGNPSGLEKYRARDAGYDATGMIVWPIEDAIADAMQGEIKSHH